uniref:Uncharacterized protein n=1 Tax=Arundo donax TaxID=35708 RepID=A0A0A8ZVN5_ARUDO
MVPHPAVTWSRSGMVKARSRQITTNHEERQRL